MAKSKLAIGAIIGAAVGVVAGVLTAPKSGKELRSDLKDRATDLTEKAATKKDALLEKARTVKDDIKKDK